MLYRLHVNDWRVIAHYLGLLVLLGAAALLVPLAVACVAGEWAAACDFAVALGIMLVVGAGLSLACVRKVEMDWRQALIVTGFSWLVLAALGAIPLYLSGSYASFFDAFFDATSCYTTTGLSVALDVDHMALSLDMWRVLMGLMGGIGVIVIALALGLFGNSGAAESVYQAEGRTDHVMPTVRMTARVILRIVGVVLTLATLANFVLLFVGGMDAGLALLNAFWVAACSFATIGVSGHSAGIVFYHSWGLEGVACVCMLLGAVSFLLYGDLWKGVLQHVFRDLELRAYAAWIVVLCVLLMSALASAGFFDGVPSALRRGLFTLCSAVTNTGFSTLYPSQVLYAMSSGALFVFILGMCVGGCAQSTSGGIKVFRIAIIAKSIVQTVRDALTSDRVRARTFYYRHGRRLLAPEVVSGAMTITMLYLCAYVIGAVAGILLGYDARPAMVESVSAATNSGLTLGVTAASMPTSLKVVYILEMWLGRLEFLTIFALLAQVALTFIPRRQGGRR